MDSIPAFILLSVLFLLLSGFFSATETAFTSLQMIKVRRLASEGDKKYKRILAICENYDKLLSTILIGNNVVNIAYSTISAVFFTKQIAENESLAAIVSTAVTTVTVLVFGEITPKNLAKESPDGFALFSLPIIRFLIFVLTPINYIFTLWKKLVIRLFRVKKDSSVTEQDIISLVSEAEHVGEIDKKESEIIRSAVTFGDLEASDVMTPRVRVAAVENNDEKESVFEKFRQSGFSRLPVFDGTIDNIVGIITLREFYEQVMMGDKDLSDIIQEATFVSGHAKIDDILKELQKTKNHLAVVIDDYGGTAGIITIEDIVEELVGEIYDEYDKIEEAVTARKDGGYTVSGGTEIDSLPEELHIPEGESYTTLAGWILSNIQHIPEENEEFSIGSIKGKILSFADNRIGDVLLQPISDSDEENEKE